MRKKIYPITKICLFCKNEFIIKIGNKKNNKFCSHKCYSKSLIGKKQSQKTIEKRRERLIGKKRPPFTLEWRKKISLNNNAPKGSKSHLWKGGLWKDKMRYYHYKNFEYKTWRNRVFEQDNWTCQKCKIKGGYLHPHHIKSYTYYPELRYEVLNGITYHKDCHLQIHKELRRSQFVEE
jgi:hypothetical protein